MTIIYISNCNTSVFNSQVIFLVNYLVQNYSFNKFYLMIGYASKKEKNTVPIDLIHPSIEVIFFKRYPDYPFFNVLNIRRLKQAIKKLRLEDSNKTVIHVRTEILGYYLLKALPSFKVENILIDVK